MRFHTTRETLDQVRDFHAQASRFYHQLADYSSERKRVKMMLDYLSAHERKLAEAVKRYEDDIDKGLADTWFDGAPELKLASALATLGQPGPIDTQRLARLGPTDVDDVLRLGLHLDDYLVWAFGKLADQADTDESRDTFENLLAEAQTDKRKLVRDTLGLEGL